MAACTDWLGFLLTSTSIRVTVLCGNQGKRNRERRERGRGRERGGGRERGRKRPRERGRERGRKRGREHLLLCTQDVNW